MMMYRFHDILEKNSAIRLHAMPPKPILAVGACTHVVFSTFKSTKAGLRSQIESNTRSNLEGMSKRVYTIWFDDDDVEKNVHGTPVLRSMYTQAFSQFPDADTYTYVNGDLLMDGDFVRTADAVVSASKGGHLSRRFLVVGKRTNVDWRGKTTMEDFDAHHSEGTLFWNNAQDYFMVSKQTFDWEKAIPAFVVGRAGYDNWLVDTAFHDPEVALMDATPTIRVIHQTDHEGNVAQGGPNRPDKSYNHELGKGEWDHGTTDHAEYETFWKTDGTVGVRDRKGLSDIGGMTHDMVNVLNLASTRENPRTTACTHIVTDSGAGLFSNMMGVLAAMAKYGTNIQVQWKNTMYLAPNSENVWTQYFEPVSDCVVDALTKTIRMSGWDHGFADPEAALAPMAQRIRLNSDTQTEFNKSWTWRGQASLGVHIRSTDRATDGEGIKQHLLVVPTQRYVQHIQRYLDEHANTKTIFVASDTQGTLDALVNEFGVKIKSLDVVRSNDKRSIHHGGLDTPFATGKSAVLDAWLLATTDFKLLSASQLSLTAVLKQGIHTPFFLLNEEDGYQRIRTMFPSRPDNVVGAFPDRSRVSTPPAGTQMGHEQMAAIRDALGPNGNLLVWGLGNDSPFWNDATTGRVAFLEDDIPEAKAGTLWYDVITRKYPFLEAYKVHYHTDTVESFQQYIDSPDRWHELRLNDLPDSIRGENWDVIVVDAPLGCCNTGPARYQSIYESWRMATNHTHVFVDDYERKVEREFSQAVFGRAPDSVVRRTKAASNANEQAHFGPPFAPRSSTPRRSPSDFITNKQLAEWVGDTRYIVDEATVSTPPTPHRLSYGGEVWETPLACAIASIAHATVLPPSGQVRNETGVYAFGKWYWEREQQATTVPQALEHPVLTLVMVWNDQFQNIVFDTLPKLTVVCPFLVESPRIRVLVMNTLQQDLVREACPLSKERFLVLKEAVRAHVVYVPYFVGDGLKMGIVPPNSVRSLGSQTTPGSEVVYLARKAGTKRSVANEADVLATLRTQWPELRVVFPTSDWRQNRESVKNAAVIISPHGGAMANMIFAPVNTTIIEFTPLVQYKHEGKNERPCYFGLAHGLGFEYHAVAPSTFDFDHGSMVVPTKRLETVLDKLESSGSGRQVHREGRRAFQVGTGEVRD